jgi:hypothetical protein
MKTLRVHVAPYCRTRPQSRGMGKVAHKQARAAEVAKNYRRGETWYKGMDSDLWDTKAYTDSTLTRRENSMLKKSFWKNFR